MRILINGSENDGDDFLKKPLRWHQHRLHRRNLLKAHFRRAFYRCFQSWYRLNQHRFSLPLYLCQQRRYGILISVGEIPPEKMHFFLGYKSKGFQDGSLSFSYGCKVIDTMAWMETYPSRRPEGVICHECHRHLKSLRDSPSTHEMEWLEKEAGTLGKEAYFEEKLRVFPTVEALWEDHMFEVILQTVNEIIATAECIEIVVNKHGSSYSRITPEPEDTFEPETEGNLKV